MQTFFTADTHFGHANIIHYCNRPYSSVKEMDEALIENWNSVVGPKDEVFHVGDFSFSNQPRDYFNRLNGRKVLVFGNHDSRATKDLPWANVARLLELKFHGLKVTLCHYAMQVWNHSHHGAIQLFGHSHGQLAGNRQQLDVGVDCWNYTPVTLEQILACMETLPEYPYVLKKND